MANALPFDFIPLKTLETLRERAELASAAYSDGVRPDGFADVDLAALGIRGRNIDGPYFVKGNAAARLMERDGDWFLAFRGTDSLDDLRDYVELGPDYFRAFDRLLDAIAADGPPGRLFVTGHSLGAIAVHQLAAERAEFGDAFEGAKYATFAAPLFVAPLEAASFGYANDAIYGLLSNEPPPFVKNVYWFTSENGVDQAQPADEANLAPHGIDNHAEGLARIIAADVFKPQLGLVDRRGLDLTASVVVSGSHDTVVVPKTLDGAVVVLGIDGPLANEAESLFDRSDVIVGRDVRGASDWIDGMRGGDDLRGRAGDDVLIGGGGSDRLAGGNGDDVLHGGANRDRLSGGDGNDRFVFSDVQRHADIVLDFSAIVDRGAEADVIAISVQAFGGDASGPLDIVTATTRPDSVGDGPTALYASGAGKLFYDPDGSGERGAVLVAILDDAPALLQAGDIILIP